MNAFRRFERNTAGRDFVVGDIHGCFDMLRRAMARAFFDPTKDRLFSVGDLVDRGPSSHEAVDWLNYPWFIAVRGNHEQMAIDAAADQIDPNLYVVNGGLWFYGLDDAGKQRVAQAFAELPVAIEVDTTEGSVGLVHAEVFGDMAWPAFVARLEAGDERAVISAMWGRDRIRSKNQTAVPGIGRIMVGHTPLKERAVLGNVHYIDTGGVFGGKLTLVCLTDGQVIEEAA